MLPLKHFVCVYNNVCIFSCILQSNAKAQAVLNRIFEHLNLVERDYFGLRFLDITNQTVSYTMYTTFHLI